MSNAKGTPTKDEPLTGPIEVIERDEWTCQVCGYTPPEDSDETMFATLIGSDETHPDHFQTRCRKHHVDYLSDDPDPEFAPPNRGSEKKPDDTQKRQKKDMDEVWHTRVAKYFMLLPILFPGWFVGIAALVNGITILNPLRMAGHSSWPVAIRNDINGVSITTYVYDVLVGVPIYLAIGVVVLLITTQICIWMEPKNGIISRVSGAIGSKIKQSIK